MTRGALWTTTVLFELALLLAALLLMWLTAVRPVLAASSLDLVLGTGVGLLLAGAALSMFYLRGPFFSQLRKDFQLFLTVFGKVSILEIALISLLAGVFEEFFFRGFLQTWIVELGHPHAGVLIAALLFGLAHAISRPYPVFITLVGAGIGYLYLYTGSLASAMIAHAVYDFAALLYGARIVGVRDAA